MSHPILIFDGDCNFCRACVRWLIQQDPSGNLHYAPLQSEAARNLLAERCATAETVESVAFVAGDTVLWKSEAVFAALAHCRSKWRWLRCLRLIPRRIRDWGYDLISQNRSVISRTVGTINHRWQPPAEVADRFLER